MESPEVHSAHVRHGGGLPRWLELLIAVTALVTSISSIAIAVHHGQIMERLVQANSLPYMHGGFSDITPEGEFVLSLDLLNRGVGPAHEQSLRVKVGEQYVRSIRDLLSAALGAEQATAAYEALRPMRDGLRTRFIPGGQQQFVFRMKRTPENAQHWDALAKAQRNWSLEFCYCSVFDECWQVASELDEPEPIGECRRDEAREFRP